MSEPSFPPLRRSKSQEESRRAQLERVRAMTVEERIKAALSLSATFAWARAIRESTRR